MTSLTLPSISNFFEHGISVQNLAIMIGTLIALLFMGRFKFSFAMHHSAKQYALFALGGLLMGVGTRLANGCNVGALFTPIANFSLSGWIYLVVLLAGGILGNIFHKAMTQNCKIPSTAQAVPSSS
ncbi:MAG: YeeE/YedE thiosulfate transporter family protein [Psychromonas sp.]